jgi:hypothetical protein
VFTLYTFGDSILDSGSYNELGLTPGALIVRNDDRLFPEFRGRDLSSRGPARLVHRACDGAIADDLMSQLSRLPAPEGDAAALVTVGGNDLLGGLAHDRASGVGTFARTLGRFLNSLPVRPVFLGTVYDPTFGDDARNVLGLDPSLARENLRRVNDAIAAAAGRLGPGQGRCIDLHAHFLTGDPSWLVSVIEPSLTGTSEVRRAFLPALLDEGGRPSAAPGGA